MKLASYLVDGHPTIGIKVDDATIAPLSSVWTGGGPAPRDMIELIESWPAAPQDTPRSGADGAEPIERIDTESRWLPPVPRPSKMMGVAANNKAIFELASFAPDHPAIFSYPPSALTGHRRPIELRTEYGLTHPEPELGVVIGRRTKRITVDEALDAVFGYTIVDDVTSPTLKSGDTLVIPRSSSSSLGTGGRVDPDAPPPGFEHGDMQLTYHARSKGTDTFAPCGPWIVTRDEIEDPNALAVTLTIDDELCMEDNTGNLMYSVAEVIAHASSYFTLEPGDIIHVGTAGRGKYRLRDLDYQQRDRSERTITIDAIGSLVNPIRCVG
ncbi:fumarylacetoacetate hydrolase family protein [Micromonospora sp. ATA32]|nr:fumarylacetoacetate hydrolase family protein [Micromonospora sp. ATA32]